MKPRCAHDLRRRDNVFMAIVLLCLMPYIKCHALFRRIESPLRIRWSFPPACRGIDFLPIETGKARVSRGFRPNGTGGALESSCRPREAENPLAIFAKAAPYV